MASHQPRVPVLASLLALLAMAVPGSAAEAPPPASAAVGNDSTFFETVEVNVVNVDVYVTDSAGKPVRGLTQDDFTVLEDGKPVEVSNFYAAEGGAIAGEPLPPQQQTAAAAEVPEEQRLHLAIFVDNMNLTPEARNRALRSVKAFLADRIDATDRIVLASYDGPGSLRIRQEATGDPQAVLKAVEEIASGSAGGIGRKLDRQSLLRDIDRGLDPENPNPLTRDLALGEARQSFAGIQMYAEAQLNQARTTIGMLGRFIDSLSGLKGRKVLLYISGGIPMRPAQALFEAWSNRYGSLDRELELGATRLEAISIDATSLFQALGARANASRVTLYSLGATENLSTSQAASPGGSNWTSTQSTQEASNLAEPMVLLAAATGGMAAVENMNPDALLAGMRRDIESYYSLGYTPSHRKTGKDHKVKVVTKDRSLKLRYRESYRDRTAQEILGDQTLSALLIGQQDNPLGIALDLEQESPSPKAKDQTQLTILVKFPMGNLVLLPQDSYHEGRVTMFVGTKDDKGRVSELTQIAIPVRVKNDQLMTAMSQTVAYRTRLLLRTSPHTIAVGIRDEIGNVGSTTTAAYQPGQVVPPAEEAGR